MVSMSLTSPLNWQPFRAKKTVSGLPQDLGAGHSQPKFWEFS
jgi:hypothetical protein